MMKQKFKAWNKEEKKMSKPFTLFDIGDNRIRGVWNSPRLSFRLTDCIIRQFVGIKDKKKKEIYNGDILKVKNRFNTLESNYEVYWSENGCCFSLIHATRDGDDYGVYTRNIGLSGDEYEIIGNVYQSPMIKLKK